MAGSAAGIPFSGLAQAAKYFGFDSSLTRTCRNLDAACAMLRHGSAAHNAHFLARISDGIRASAVQCSTAWQSEHAIIDVGTETLSAAPFDAIVTVCTFSQMLSVEPSPEIYSLWPLKRENAPQAPRQPPSAPAPPPTTPAAAQPEVPKDPASPSEYSYSYYSDTDGDDDAGVGSAEFEAICSADEGYVGDASDDDAATWAAGRDSFGNSDGGRSAGAHHSPARRASPARATRTEESCQGSLWPGSDRPQVRSRPPSCEARSMGRRGAFQTPRLDSECAGGGCPQSYSPRGRPPAEGLLPRPPHHCAAPGARADARVSAGGCFFDGFRCSARAARQTKAFGNRGHCSARHARPAPCCPGAAAGAGEPPATGAQCIPEAPLDATAGSAPPRPTAHTGVPERRCADEGTAGHRARRSIERRLQCAGERPRGVGCADDGSRIGHDGDESHDVAASRATKPKRMLPVHGDRQRVSRIGRLDRAASAAGADRHDRATHDGYGQSGGQHRLAPPRAPVVRLRPQLLPCLAVAEA